MSDASSATETPRAGWSVDNRGYIHGGFDTPIFGIVKQKHNAARTRQKNKIKKSLTYGIVPDDVVAKKTWSEIQERLKEYWDTNQKENS
jgi:hypothetical protein